MVQRDTRVIRRPQHRYRLRPRRFAFRFIDGKLHETHTGLIAYTANYSTIIGRPAPPDTERPRDYLYLTTAGEPADPLTEFMLRQCMSDYVSFLHCRVCPDPHARATTDDEATIEIASEPAPADYEALLAEAGMPPVLPPLTDGGYGMSDIEELDAEVYGSTHHQRSRVAVVTPTPRRRRPLQALSPAQWKRALQKRLGLFFVLPPSEPRIMLLAEYLGRTTNWAAWRFDPDLASLTAQVVADERLRRWMHMIHGFCSWRAGIAHGRQVVREPLRLDLENRRGRFVFCFPSEVGRQEEPVARQQAIRSVLWMAVPYLIRGPEYDDRWLAAAVWIGRAYIEQPRSLASRPLTQAQVAKRFRVSRDQLAYAVRRLRDPKFAEPFWRRLEARRARPH